MDSVSQALRGEAVTARDTENEIALVEVEEAQKTRETHLMPHPDGDVWEAIRTKYQLPTPIPVNGIQSKVVLPSGWRLDRKKDDQWPQVVDENGTVVGSTFHLLTPRAPYGSTKTWFNRAGLGDARLGEAKANQPQEAGMSVSETKKDHPARNT